MNTDENKILEEQSENELKRTMPAWQISMLGIGGTIGTGLFLSSGFVMQNAGPGGTVLAYLIGGFLMYLMMSVNGELITAMPEAGGAQVFANRFINPSWGFSIGWIRWLSYALTPPAQIVASVIIIQNIFPNINTMLFMVAILIGLFLLNMTPAKDAGTSNFIFSSFKLILIAALVLVGMGIIFFGVGDVEATGFSNLWAEGGWFPVTFAAFLSTLMPAVYGFSGADMATTAASESENPEEDMPKAIKSIVLGLIGSYILAFIVLLAVNPWHQYSLDGSPFAEVFNMIGIPYAGTIINIFVLSSALSSANAFVFGSVRALWAMADEGQAPKVFSKVNKKGVPVNALIGTMLFSVLAILAAIYAADTIYLLLQSLIGIANIAVYITYVICLFKFRERLDKDGRSVDELSYTVKWFPAIPILLLVMCGLLVLGMIFDPSQLLSLAIGIPALIVLYLGYGFYEKRKTAI